MTERLLNLKTLPALLVLLLCTVCTPAWAGDGSCEVSAGGLSFPNINTSSSQFIKNQPLGSSSVTINYSCDVFGLGEFKPQLLIEQSFVDSLKALKDAGLGMNIMIEANGGSVNIPWSDITPGSSGKERRYTFGATLEKNKPTIQHSAKLTAQVFSDIAYSANSTRLTLSPAMSSVRIRPDNGGRNNIYNKDVLNFNPFNINIISNDLIKIRLSSNNIDVGYFYSGYKNKTKEISFSVTAYQYAQAAPGQNFNLPLMIQFGDGQRPFPADLTDNNTVLLIRNNDNVLNGLKLSLIKNSSPVIFNRAEKMDSDITITNNPGASVTGDYSVRVEPVPGSVLTTGEFSVTIPIIITYS
ncbi:hypothetical protein QLL71_003320 [Salmonella enterica]|nr:hypothetical protein [Salmonella enterica]ECI8026989.1 hypothetical protein [Salmonella enterica subsp. enterica serovar Ramatgan]EDI0467614.1 hypothetical protein [Salmonella enterica subsp. enterica serovar Newport]HBJ5626461.1 hypothetical protein [Salmonella enterica subsp. enterica serovar Hvittingfoss]EBB0848892.1 hypothetical protein [Salmonella enterica]